MFRIFFSRTIVVKTGRSGMVDEYGCRLRRIGTARAQASMALKKPLVAIRDSACGAVE